MSMAPKYPVDATTFQSDQAIHIGAPDEFFGLGLVGFVDILGFSNSVYSNWANTDDSPIGILHRLRDEFDGSRSKSANLQLRVPGELLRVFEFRVHTLGDAMTISVAIPSENDTYRVADIAMAFHAICGNTMQLWKKVIKQGFTIRGAIEFGQVYWDNGSIIGPAMIDAYRLESEMADSSRLIVGPRLLNTFKNEKIENAQYISWARNCLQLHDDKIIALKESGLGADGNILALKKMAENSGGRDQKYARLVERLEAAVEPDSEVSVSDIRVAMDKLIH